MDITQSRVSYNVDTETFEATLGTVTVNTTAEETLITASTAQFTLDPDTGFMCIGMEPLRVYLHKTDNPIKDFAVRDQENPFLYNLCLLTRSSNNIEKVVLAKIKLRLISNT